MTERIVMRQGCRILTPSQYYKLREQLDQNIGYRLITDALLNTGMRTIEFWALMQHPDWYHSSSRVIDLPKSGASKKEKSGRKERTIRLTAAGCKSLDTLFSAGIAYESRQAMGQALKRASVSAGLGKEGIMPKMFRKMLVSWLIECRKEIGADVFDITASMGHDEKTIRDNYLGTKWDKQDREDMLDFLKGWRGE